MKEEIVIAGMARTPIGNFQGAFTGVAATELGSHAIKAAMTRAGTKADAVEEVLMGCVLPAGLGQAPARQAALGAGLPKSAGCVTVNKVCGSGMKTVMLAHDSIAAGVNDVVVAGGMEAMTNAPHLLPTGRTGIKYGHGQIFDHMAYDGLEDPYNKHAAMGIFAEKCAREWQFSRAEQDEFSMRSVTRAQDAIKTGKFADEIAAYEIATRKGPVTVKDDEKPATVDSSKIPSLRAAFEKDGTVTAGSSSAISDGAAALVITRGSKASNAVARIVAHATHSQEPEWFTTAPVDSIRKLLDRAGWAVKDVDLFEINEAFAVVAEKFIRDLDLDREKVNVNGG
ncbi:MAG: acetyl-CoA C-acyltransferase, partial [Parvularculaceae bacterium]|nr:acetyl-CoA C-acyltransferase [Parvularculaceae bacterium]